MNDEQEVAVEERQEVAPWKAAIIGARERFNAIATKDQIVDWQRESMFALQAIETNEYLRKAANNDPGSLRNAIINVAACGITLNRAAQYAALVPRDGSVCLDIMYRGLIKIATDAGSIRWVKAELVHATDRFAFRGPMESPSHDANVFSKDRGPVVGVYCVAKTVDGDLLTEVMSVDEVNAIRGRSEYWKKKQSGPWATDWGEMAKKTIIKRARKTWPESKTQGTSERLQTAVDLANTADGYAGGFEQVTEAITPTTGALAALPEPERDQVENQAHEVRSRFTELGVDAASSYVISLGLDADHEVALWALLDSKIRTPLKKAMTVARKAA